MELGALTDRSPCLAQSRREFLDRSRPLAHSFHGLTDGVMPGGRAPGAPMGANLQSNGFANNLDTDDSKLRLKLEQSDAEDIIGSYFRNDRLNDIARRNQLDRNRQIDEHRSFFPTERKTWDSLMSGVIYTNDIYERASPQQRSSANGTAQHNRRQQLNNMASLTSRPAVQQQQHLALSPVQARRPARLEAIAFNGGPAAPPTRQSKVRKY